jgi:hypothetical protein
MIAAGDRLACHRWLCSSGQKRALFTASLAALGADQLALFHIEALLGEQVPFVKA